MLPGDLVLIVPGNVISVSAWASPPADHELNLNLKQDRRTGRCIQLDSVGLTGHFHIIVAVAGNWAMLYGPKVALRWVNRKRIAVQVATDT